MAGTIADEMKVEANSKGPARRTCTRCAGAGYLVSGDELRKLRNALGLSKADMARKAGCSAQFIGMIELGRYNASARIAKAYGVAATSDT